MNQVQASCLNVSYCLKPSVFRHQTEGWAEFLYCALCLYNNLRPNEKVKFGHGKLKAIIMK